MSDWQPVRRTRAFEDVIAQIEQRIAGDGLRVGDRLPGERQLAEQLQVSRSSVREAMRVLETLGVVSSQVGRGPDAGAVLTSRPAGALTDLLRLHLGLASLSLEEVVDARLMIEKWSASHAALHGADLSALASALERMGEAATAEEFVEHDTAFHVAVAEASGNRLTSAMMRSLRDSLRRYAVEAVERLGDTDGLMADHRRIYRAIATGDAAEAASAVEDHLHRAYPDIRRPLRSGDHRSGG
ncbi:DNA-binding FadR family transcriptional regulator [Streptosporangium becharense]|uniref:DNA-binding FadR family transcriptional regulator n=1 Tax=Streptosporangium becharense TaxID=1816182 RepID=A0A7W9MI94_9ACTN|nr:FadR/GntR family transcriptional regulator [Streptosporangium becharense]MBB2910975.1 DNA-binding FadR family transcriptional regulator [Streptosporangium becharense]MBB5821967.1 DNA-binding FadR family transcriptional regulator [Streptosporangium becharense]